MPDFAVANNADDTISVFLGKADGTFTAALHPSRFKQLQVASRGEFLGSTGVQCEKEISENDMSSHDIPLPSSLP